MKIYAYTRVSTQQQSLERQEKAVYDYCKENDIIIDREFSDKISGKTFERKEYLEMKRISREDDIIIIKELDRFGRTMDLIKDEWQYFMNKGVRIIVIDMPLISSDLKGKKTLDQRFLSNLVFEVLCYSAEKEREKLSQRTKEALAVKKKNGVVLGRRTSLNENDMDELITMFKANYTYVEMAERFGCTKQTIISTIKRLGLPNRRRGRR